MSSVCALIIALLLKFQNNSLVLVPGKGETDAIIMLRRIIEKALIKEEKHNTMDIDCRL